MIMNKDLKITIRWFPPSWLLIKAGSKVIYIDPAWIQKNFDKYPKKVIFSHYPEPMDGLPEPDLPKANYIFITHHHQDHIKTATINRLKTAKTAIYAPARCAELIGRKFNEVKSGDEIIIGDFSAKIVYAYNTAEGKSTRKVHHSGECVGYLLTIRGKKIYHAGDTDIIPEMKNLGVVDIALLPVGGTFTTNLQEALEAIQIINPKIFIPMHYLSVKEDDVRKATEKLSKTKVEILKTGDIFEM